MNKEDGKLKGSERVQMARIFNPGPLMTTHGLFSTIGAYINPDKHTVSDYEKILDGDETVNSGIEFIKLAVMARIGDYSHENEEIADYIKKQLENVRGDITEVFDGILSALWAGFSVGEMILDIQPDIVNLLDIQFLDPKWVQFVLHTEGIEKNTIKEIVQSNYYAMLTGDPLPVRKSLIYTHRKRFGNPYGFSRIKSIYNDYYVKKNLMVFWAQTLERHGCPVAVGYTDNPNGKIIDPDGTQMTNLEYMTETLRSLQTGSGVAISGENKIEFLEGKPGLGDDFENAILYLNKMMYRGLLIPSLVGDNDNVGSNALGQTHFDLFLLAVERLRNEVVDVLIDQLIRRLIVWQFGPQDNYGEFQLSQFDAEQAEKMANIFDSMTNTGYLTPDRYEDMQHVREAIGAPGVSEGEWQKQLDARREEEARRQEAVDKMLQAKEQQEEPEEVPESEEAPKNQRLSKFSDYLTGFITHHKAEI